MVDRVEITKMRMEEIFDYYAGDELKDRLIMEISEAFTDGVQEGMYGRDKMIREFLDK